MSDQPPKKIVLSALSLPFPQDDIEWRVSRAGSGRKGIYCNVLAYITARAIQARLDDVCGRENWQNAPPTAHELRPGVSMISAGIAIRIGDEWVTKYDVAEPSSDRGGFEGTSAKGGFSGAMKRAGACWGIGRYLYRLDEAFAEVSETGGKDWNYAKLKDGTVYYWKPPRLPSWALPKEPEHEITQAELNAVKREWKDKFAAKLKNPAELLEGFARFVEGIAGEFPVSDYTCWSRDVHDRCSKRIADTKDSNGPDGDVPFDGEGGQ